MAEGDLFTPVVPDESLDGRFITVAAHGSSAPARAMARMVFADFDDSDGNFIEQFQTTGFDARTWELFLFAYLVSSGFAVDRAHVVPDFMCEKAGANWTGIALVVPRSIYMRVRSERDELNRAGVYVLTGPSQEQPDLDRVYIGEAEVLRSRLDQHHAGKDFWTRAVIFTKKDASLNKAHVKYIESRLVVRANLADRAEVENGNVPQLPALSEAEAADTEAFVDDMLLIYPVVGVRAFEPLQPRQAVGQNLHVHGVDANGEGQETSDGFLVFKGSRARADAVPSIHAYMAELRKKLIEEGVLEQTLDGLRFTRDYLFNSPSTAAGVLLGRAANGRTEWKDGEGRTLKEIQTAQVAATLE